MSNVLQNLAPVVLKILLDKDLQGGNIRKSTAEVAVVSFGFMLGSSADST
jgi:hypothetical protein